MYYMRIYWLQLIKVKHNKYMKILNKIDMQKILIWKIDISLVSKYKPYLGL